MVVRVETSEGTFALRGWPAESLPRARILELHRFLRHLKSRGLPVAVPICADGSSIIAAEGEWWQVEPWLPGEACTQSTFSRSNREAASRLDSLMETLARVHLAAQDYVPTARGQRWFSVGRAPCPAVLQRRGIIAGWRSSRLVRAHDSLGSAPLEFRQPAGQVLSRFMRMRSAIDAELAAFEHIPVRLHPCWRDLWSEHVLFTGSAVTGLIDPAATRSDHAATDLSRLLGSLFGEDREMWNAALERYRAVRPLSEEDLGLVRVMDRSSVLLSGLTWIARWMEGGVTQERLAPVVERLRGIASRLVAED